MIFLTETYSGLKAGKRISANSWDEAELKCPEGFRILGEFVCDINAPEYHKISMN